jgi:hypothetical protein
MLRNYRPVGRRKGNSGIWQVRTKLNCDSTVDRCAYGVLDGFAFFRLGPTGHRYQRLCHPHDGGHLFISPAASAPVHGDDKVRESVEVLLSQRQCSQQPLPTRESGDIIAEHRVVGIRQRPIRTQQVRQPRDFAVLGHIDGYRIGIPRAYEIGFTALDRLTLLLAQRPILRYDAGRNGTTLPSSAGPARMIAM